MNIEFYEISLEEKLFFSSTINTREHSILYIEDSLNVDNVRTNNDLEILSCFVNSELSRNVLENFPNLKCILVRATGYNNIDINYCKKNNISVYNTPNYGSRTVAEYTLTLLLSLIKRIQPQISNTKKGIFNNSIVGSDLQGKTIGVIGTGRIGLEFIKLMRGFELEILAYDISPNKLYDKLDFEYVSFNDLIERSDIISLHIPFTASSRYILSKLTFDKMKDGVYIINTARGELINIKDLTDFYKKGKFGGIALDTFEGEIKVKSPDNIQNSKSYKLIQELNSNQNVIITPHNAYNTHEAMQRKCKKTLDNFYDYFASNSGNIT